MFLRFNFCTAATGKIILISALFTVFWYSNRKRQHFSLKIFLWLNPWSTPNSQENSSFITSRTAIKWITPYSKEVAFNVTGTQISQGNLGRNRIGFLVQSMNSSMETKAYFSTWPLSSLRPHGRSFFAFCVFVFLPSLFSCPLFHSLILFIGNWLQR